MSVGMSVGFRGKSVGYRGIPWEVGGIAWDTLRYSSEIPWGTDHVSSRPFTHVCLGRVRSRQEGLRLSLMKNSLARQWTTVYCNINESRVSPSSLMGYLKTKIQLSSSRITVVGVKNRGQIIGIKNRGQEIAIIGDQQSSSRRRVCFSRFEIEYRRKKPKSELFGKRKHWPTGWISYFGKDTLCCTLLLTLQNNSTPEFLTAIMWHSSMFLQTSAHK